MPDLDALLTEAREMDAGVLVTRYDPETGTFVKEPSIVARLAAALRTLNSQCGVSPTLSSVGESPQGDERRSVQVPEEWEYGVLLPAIRTEPSFVGNEEGALYFMGRPSSSVDKYALDGDEKTLVRRRKASPWEPLPSPGTTTEEETK